MSSDLAELRQIIDVFGATEEEAAAALVSAFRPPMPGSTANNWRRLEHFGFSAPTGAEIWDVYCRADFRCEKCGRVRGLTVDHANGDSRDHRPANLRVRCRSCNRPNAHTGREEHQDLRLVRYALAGGSLSGPYTKLRHRAGLPSAGGCNSIVKFLRHRLGWWGRVRRLVGG